MRVPGRLKDYYRYLRILGKYRVNRPTEYVKLLSPTSPAKVLDLLPFTPQIIFDIGANKGLWTWSYYSIIGDKAQFYLFEPIPNLCEELRARFRACANVHVYELALSSETGFRDFGVARQSDFSSLETINQPEVDLHCPELRPDFVSRIRVETDTLDDFCTHHIRDGTIDLLKLDVQGHELRVLEGAINTLDLVNSVLVEWNVVNFYNSDSDFMNVHRFLTEHDFVLSGIPFQYRANDRLVYADALYLNSK